MNPLVLLLLLLPVLEIAVMIQVGAWIGAGPAVLLIVAAFLSGALLLRHQGLATLRRAQETLERGEAPVGAVFQGFCVVAGAVLLMIPGFLSDVAGLLLLLPFPRDAIGRWLLNRLRASGALRVWTAETGGGRTGGDQTGAGSAGAAPAGRIIDVEYTEVPADTPRLEEKHRGADDRKGPDGKP